MPTIATKVTKFNSEPVNIGCLGKSNTQKVATVNEHMNTRKFQMYQAMSHNRHSVSHVISKNILKEIKGKGTQRVLIQPQDIPSEQPYSSQLNFFGSPKTSTKYLTPIGSFSRDSILHDAKRKSLVFQGQLMQSMNSGRINRSIRLPAASTFAFPVK